MFNSQSAYPPDTADRTSRNALILLVEDNPVERLLVSRILLNAGFRVVAVECGEEALLAMMQHVPALVLLDALLPDIDGFEVCERLRAHPKSRHTPIIMLTGLDDGSSIDHSYEVGATDFITKPINHSLLVHRIRYVLRARQTMDALRQSRESLANAQRVAGLGHWEVDLETGQVRASEQLWQLFETHPPDTSDQFAAILEVCHPEDRERIASIVQRSIREVCEAHFDHRVILPDGEERVMEVHLWVFGGDERDHLLGITMDVSERKESEREILRLAYFDRLTSLPNRSFLERYIEQSIPRAHLSGATVALLAIDLDLFSRVNNAMGHSAGDAVLRQVGNRLSRLLSAPSPQSLLADLSVTTELGRTDQGDLVARLTADTFVVVLNQVDRNDTRVARLTAELRQLFQQAFIFRGQELFVTASIGVAHSDSGSCAAEMLLQRADLALHEAKAQGRDAVREYHSGLVAQVSSQLAMQSHLRKALERGEFVLHYQPRIHLADGSVAGFEALIRWHHPLRGLVSPGEFISVAEETGQIVDIGRWALQSACLQQRRWLDAGMEVGRMAVNVSARQFRDPGLVEMVRRVLEQTGLPAQALELEITEGVLMSDPRASTVVEALRNEGVAVALDDFGTGFCSLSYLIRFPIDVLKVDRCFVQDITRGSQQAAIVAAVTSLSHQLRLHVVAEGVETEAELAMVRELGCEQVQGYLFCRPLPVDELERWLQAHAASRARNIG